MTDAALCADLTTARRRRAAGGTGMGIALAVASVAGTATGAHAQAQDYTVKPGDTVSHIALRTSTTVSQIVSANRLDQQASIRAGQRLVIPSPAAPAASEAVAAAPATGSHTVVSGDTVSALASRYGTTTAAIVQANSLNSAALIRIGQVLTIPGATASPAPADASASSGSTAQLVGNTFAGRTYPAATVASANENKATLLAIGVPTKAEMQRLVASTAQDMGVDPALAQAIAFQESGFNQSAVSPANAIGTMQVIPTSGDWASDLVGRQLNLLDPQDNVVAGVAILRQLVRTSPDLGTAIASYYQGQAGVRKHGMYPDTRRYVANVQTLMSRFS